MHRESKETVFKQTRGNCRSPPPDTLSRGTPGCDTLRAEVALRNNLGKLSNGSLPVSKTGNGGSIPSLPALWRDSSVG